MAREPDAPAESRTGSIRACGAPQAAVRLGAARDDPARGSGLNLRTRHSRRVHSHVMDVCLRGLLGS